MAHPELYDKVLLKSGYSEKSGVIVKLTPTDATVELTQIEIYSVLISDLIELEPGVWEYALT